RIRLTGISTALGLDPSGHVNLDLRFARRCDRHVRQMLGVDLQLQAWGIGSDACNVRLVRVRGGVNAREIVRVGDGLERDRRADRRYGGGCWDDCGWGVWGGGGRG